MGMPPGLYLLLSLRFLEELNRGYFRDMIFL